ncbi:hypothetical protein G3N56_18225 [Desulfovibrio sulfodismutans]|uniref:Uncharacterized protein n=1 Tax=Desulfolutivibrio sulfodismutans TaxID=63561 RepID=A0A7K3NR30_9BACT|nr:hypothetical protein [Desulfolutivibrio sulfodismutans]NDY58676.1 hypothetical protein [Desulfolutivibrio sulfodismutans]QLA10864.1 hypothetical protein GD606_00495 [Desulfolutivibrio sulfodismutans DSM 3696]
MKRMCQLCGEVVSEMDFYVVAAGAVVCSSCIVARGVRVCRAHPGQETAENPALGREGYGRMAVSRAG